MHIHCRILVLSCLCAASAISAHAQEAAGQGDDRWNQFRGPGGSGVVEGAVMPASLAPSDAVWTAQLPGSGAGSMAIWDNRVFLLAADPDTAERRFVCLDLQTGKQLWIHRFASRPHHLHARSTYASGTPCCDADRVYTAWSDPDQTVLTAFTHDGELVWSRDLGPFQAQHGAGTSPMRAGPYLVYFDSQQKDQLKPDQRPGQSRMLALNPATGETQWETNLTTTRVCYGVPLLAHNDDGSKWLVDANTGDGLFALDLQTGNRVWNLRVFSMRCVSSAMQYKDLFIGTSGSGGGGNHLVAVRPPKGDKPAQEVYRITRNAPYVPTPVIKDDLMYLAADNGVLSCVRPENGKVVWSKRAGGNISASPIIVGDSLLYISLDGAATVVKTGERYEKVGEWDFGEPIQATPAYANDRLLIRTGGRVYCFTDRDAA